MTALGTVLPVQIPNCQYWNQNLTNSPKIHTNLKSCIYSLECHFSVWDWRYELPGEIFKYLSITAETRLDCDFPNGRRLFCGQMSKLGSSFPSNKTKFSWLLGDQRTQTTACKNPPFLSDWTSFIYRTILQRFIWEGFPSPLFVAGFYYLAKDSVLG